MVEGGLIRQSCSGIFHILPMGQRALDKLSCLVHSAMKSIGAQKMTMPLLAPAALWKKTGKHVYYRDLTRVCPCAMISTNPSKYHILLVI